MPAVISTQVACERHQRVTYLQVSALHQQARASQAEAAEAQHQASLTAMKLRHAEEQSSQMQEQVGVDGAACKRVGNVSSLSHA